MKDKKTLSSSTKIIVCIIALICICLITSVLGLYWYIEKTFPREPEVETYFDKFTPTIQLLEEYKVKNGHYPQKSDSFQIEDINIQKTLPTLPSNYRGPWYDYDPSNDGYQLLFSYPSFDFYCYRSNKDIHVMGLKQPTESKKWEYCWSTLDSI